MQAERRDPRDARVLDAGVRRRRAPSPRRARAPRRAARRRPARRPRRQHARRARRARRCPRPRAAATGTARRRGVRPEAGLSTPSASTGSPLSGDITTPARRQQPDRATSVDASSPFTPDPSCVETNFFWKATNSATAGAASTHGAGQDRAERVRGPRRDGADVVGQRHRERLHRLLLGHEERPQELVPRADEGQQHRGEQRRLAQRDRDPPAGSTARRAPSIRAASKSSAGSCRKNWRKTNTAVELIANGRIIPR